MRLVHVAGDNGILLRGSNIVKIVFHNDFQDYVWVRIKNGEYRFIVGYPIGKKPCYGTLDTYANGELETYNIDTLTHLCTYFFDDLSGMSAWLEVTFNTVGTAITMDSWYKRLTATLQYVAKL